MATVYTYDALEDELKTLMGDLPEYTNYHFIFWDYADEYDGVEYAEVQYFCAPYASDCNMLIPLIGK